MDLQPLLGQGLLIRGYAITLRHTPNGKTRYVSSVRHRDNTQQTDIHAPGGIQIHDPSNPAGADPPLRRRGHWDRQNPPNTRAIMFSIIKITENEELTL
jgi:hypothetical protein